MRFAALVLALVVGLGLAGRAEAAGRVALIIGNNAYEGTRPLANPVNDATAIAESLQGLGFQVYLATDVDRRDAVEAIGSFSSAIDGAEIALFFFAGHGMQLGGQNLLLPTDVSVETEWALRASAIDAQEVIAAMERRAEVAIAILDACRDNPYVEMVARNIGTTRSVAVDRGLGPMRLSGRGALIAYAAAAGDVAADGSGAHSPFAAALLEEIDAPDVEVGLMFRRVAKRVRDETRGDQHPEVLVRLVDEVYLNPQGATPAVAAVPTPQAEQPAVVVADASRQAAPGRVTTGDRRFFGTRVVHEPPWAAAIVVPPPSGWRPAAPVSLAESAGNDTRGTAESIPLAANVELRLAPAGESDWFPVEVPVAGELRLDAAGVPAEIDLAAQVLDADMVAVGGWQAAPAAGADFAGRYPLPRPGRYWIEVADGNRDRESGAAFTLRFDFVPADDPFEPNDGAGAATPMPTTVEVAPAIFPVGDHDWFKVFAPEPGLLTVSATGVPKNLDVVVQVLDLGKNSVRGWAGPDRPGGDTVLAAELAEPGTYFVEVADGNNDAAATDPYRLSFAFAPVADAGEPNNVFGEAVIVGANESRRAAIFPRGDTDWLAIDVDHPGELRLLASNSPKDLDLHLQVHNADKRSLSGWMPPMRRGGDNEGSVDLPAPGRYFIELADGNSDASSPDLFDLSLAFTAEPDQYEPNNGPAAAVPLTLGGQILFNILPLGDTDWFRVEVPAAGELSLLIEESAENLDLHYQVLDGDLVSLSGWVPPFRRGGVNEGFVDLPKPGVYYLQLADGNGDARSIEPATLTTAFTPVADARLEPNNGFGSAVPLVLGEAVGANILPRGDTDWFVVEAPRAGSFRVVIDEVDADMDVVVNLSDADGRAGGWQGPARKGGVTEAAIPVPAAGSYRLAVADGNHDARSKKPYRLTVTFE